VTVAEDDGRIVGFVHAGFGANEQECRLNRDWGVIAIVIVAATHRRRGVGRELVRRAEEYLRGCGSTVIYAGPMRPLDPFYLGLYGGSELPGILRSDADAHLLVQSLGYRAVDECIVFQRSLSGPIGLPAAPMKTWANKLEFVVQQEPPAANWWTACQFGAVDNTRFSLRVIGTSDTIAEAHVWEMYPLQKTWNAEAVGIVDVEVADGFRGQGVATLLVTQIMRHCRELGLTLAEAQTMVRNEAACRLYRRLGFQEVDRGVAYRRNGSA
jgi:ribosomal protein S18 acetylase RimI-like enzyme